MSQCIAFPYSEIFPLSIFGHWQSSFLACTWNRQFPWQFRDLAFPILLKHEDLFFLAHSKDGGNQEWFKILPPYLLGKCKLSRVHYLSRRLLITGKKEQQPPGHSRRGESGRVRKTAGCAGHALCDEGQCLQPRSISQTFVKHSQNGPVLGNQPMKPEGGRCSVSGQGTCLGLRARSPLGGV